MTDQSKEQDTRIDLGDDLLEPTQTPHSKFSRSQRLTPHQIEDELQSAKILFGEGLLEEAKKILRKILIADSTHLVAQRLLEEIQQQELKEILTRDEKNAHRIFREKSSSKEEDLLDPVSIDAVLRQLDQDLNLGLSSPDSSLITHQLSLFQDEKAMNSFVERLDQELVHLSTQDRVDIGIGFMEMGFYDFAIRVFKTARDIDQTQSLRLSLISLLAQALQLAGHPFESILEMQPIIEDPEIKVDDKIEFFYCMGQAHERLKDPKQAAYWFREASKIDPHYRDLGIRMRESQVKHE